MGQIFKMVSKNRGQVWVETVLYTLIGLALMGLVLAFIMPKINESKDRLVIEQTISSLGILDEKIVGVASAPGNVRQVDFLMKKGELKIQGVDDKIIFILSEMKSAYSEPGVEIDFGGRMKILTEEVGGGEFKTNLILSYSNNITYSGSDEIKVFNPASTPYIFSINGLGDLNDEGRQVIDLRETSGE
jgi:hypothetical protein